MTSVFNIMSPHMSLCSRNKSYFRTVVYEAVFHANNMLMTQGKIYVFNKSTQSYRLSIEELCTSICYNTYNGFLPSVNICISYTYLIIDNRKNKEILSMQSMDIYKNNWTKSFCKMSLIGYVLSLSTFCLIATGDDLSFKLSMISLLQYWNI